MKLESAKAGLVLAGEKVAELGLRGLSIAIVDSGGVLVAFERSTGLPAFTGVIAEAKAATSAAYGMPTAVLHQIDGNLPKLLDPAAARLGGRYSIYGGGHPVVDNGHVIGAVGVSGASEEQDAAIAAEMAARIVASETGG